MPYKFNPFTGSFDWTGSPGGSNTQVQFNDGGSFGGASQIVYDKAQGLTGVQRTSPQAPLHVTGASGLQIAAPTGLSATLVEDVAVSTPTSVTSTIVYGPSSPNPLTISFTEIDYVSTATVSQNTGSGNYICNGQTIYYRLYCYKSVGGIRVATSSYYSTSFTDTINDGSTQFTIDITSIAAASIYFDGFIIQKSYDGSNWPYAVDIGTASSYNDNDFTNTDAFEVSAYQANGATWYGEVSQYKILAGGHYRSSYTTNNAVDSNSGLGLIVGVSGYGPLADDGYMMHQADGGSNYRDIGTATSYYDWGSTTGITTDYPIFDDYAFPIFNTSLTGSSGTGSSFNYFNGNFIANGSSWTVEVWEYRIHPETGQYWFVGTPDTNSVGTDDNSFNFFQIDWGCTQGDGDGRYVVVLQNGSPVYEEDVGNTNSGSLVGATSSISTKPDISTYSGVPRTFNLYGYVTSPSLKYSNGSATTSVSDSNTAPYWIYHSFSGPGNATHYKLIESSYRNGYVYSNTVVSEFYQTYAGVGDATVTPSSLGYLANGSNLTRTYTVYSYANSYGMIYYSPTGTAVQTTDPNDSKYYTVSLSWSSPGITAAKVKRTTGATSVYLVIGATSLSDTTAITWNASSTLTPTAAKTMAAIIERDTTNTLDAPLLVLRNTGTSKTSKILLDYNNGASTAGEYGINNSGDFYIKSFTNNLYVGDYTGPHSIIGGSPRFNYQGSVGSTFWYRGSTITYLMYLQGDYGTAFFGTNTASWTSDPSCLVYMQSQDGIEPALTIGLKTGASITSPALNLRNDSGTELARLNNYGQLSLAASAPSQSHLYIGAGDGSYAQIRLVDSSSLVNVSGGISFYNNEFYGANIDGNMRKFLQTPSTYTVNSFAYVDTNGRLVADNRLYWTGTLLQSNQTLEITTGLLQFPTGNAIKVGKTISSSNTTDVIVGTANTVTGTHEGGTVFGRGCTASGQRGLVAGTSCSQTGGGNSYIVAGYGASFSGSNGGAIGINISNSTSNSLMLGMDSARYLLLDTNTASTHRVINKTETSGFNAYYDIDANAAISGIRFYKTGVLKYTISNSATDVFQIIGSGGSYFTSNVAGAFAINSATTTTASLWIKNIVATTNKVLVLQHIASGTGDFIDCQNSAATSQFRVSSSGSFVCNSGTINGNLQTNGLTLSNNYNIAVGTTNGTKIATATAQKLGFWNATPIVQPVTGGTAATLVSNAGTTLTSTDTFDGYTLAQVVKALRNMGLLA